MEGTTILTIAIPVLVALGALVLFTTARRRDTDRLTRETRRRDRGDSPFLPGAGDQPSGRAYERLATAPAPGTALERSGDVAVAPYLPPDPETLGVTRRQFFNRSIVMMFILGLSGFGGSVLAFLWPTLSAGFGSKLTVGKLDDILGEINDAHEPKYVSEGRFYLSAYPTGSVAKAEKSYSSAVIPGMESGIVALYQKCPHLGCRVPFCATSQWFECGCHGSQYNRVGEKKGGPAPRGMSLFPVEISGDTVTVDTSIQIEGVPIGTNTTGQEAEGPHCVGATH